jgi:anthranilate phosphoribosyltransferase
VGVYSEELLRPVAEALAMLGKRRAMVVHGLDGLDEISLSAPTRVVELLEGGGIRDYTLNPEDFGIVPHPASSLLGGSARENAHVARTILDRQPGGSGPGDAGAITEAVCLNAGAALFICGLAESVREGYHAAKKAVDSGAARKKLDEIVKEGKEKADQETLALKGPEKGGPARL